MKMKTLLLQSLLVSASAHDGHHGHKDTEWSPMAPLPNGGLSDMTATYLPTRGSVLVAGGCDQDQIACDWWDADDACTYCPSVSKQVFMYDVAKDLWRRGLDAPRPRYRHAAARDPAGNVYLVGGRDAEDEIVGEVDMFNGTTAKWQTMDFKVFRSDLGAAFSKGSLIVVGGYDADYAAQKDTLDIEVATSKFRAGATLREARGDLGLAVTDHGRAFAVGGWSDADWCNPLATVEQLDLNSNWPDFVPAPALKIARGDKAVVALKHHVVVIGGEHNNGCQTGSTPVDDVEVYSTYPAGSDWEVVGSIPEEKFRGAAVTVEDSIFKFGGQASQSSACGAGVAFCFPVTDHVWRLDVEDWEKEPSPSGKKSKKSSGLSKTSEIVVAIAACVAGILLFVLLFICCKSKCCRKSEHTASTWQDPPAGMELGKTPRASDPPPGHWRP
mmetsp:Transcript_13309/g.41020  ORF Transcript_13309/g.41020 Transcript_13309/m.41020 type:complete len:442 (+) Transcript_13309:139-1464(+)